MTAFWFPGAERADKPALILSNGESISHGQLALSAADWAEKLRHVAGGRRPLVALEFITTPDAIAAYLGTLLTGFPLLLVAPTQLDADHPLRSTWRPDLMIRPAEAACGIGGPQSPADGTPCMDLRMREGWEQETGPAPHPDLALLLSTSGSTGDPKLVRLSAQNIASNAEAIASYLGISHADRAATTLPLFYSYGLSVLNSYMAAGAALVLTDPSVTEQAFFDQACAGGVTSLALVPHQFELLDKSGFQGTEIPSLRYVTQAGGKLQPSLVEKFARLGRDAGWQLFIMYGQTEAAPRISYVPPEALPQAAGTIGRAIPGGRLWICGEDGHEITEIGPPGELVYQGPNVMMGYGLCRADLAKGPELDELHTGDIAVRTADGYFCITGRLKRFVKVFGLRLSLDQIEALLHERGIPAQAVEVEEELVLLHHEPGKGDAAKRTVMSEYGLPDTVIHTGLMTEMPLLPSGKPNHTAIRAFARELIPHSRAERRNALQGESLADVLKRATRRRDLGPKDTFTTLGGDSLSYLQVQMTLEERLGQAPKNWENMTLETLEKLVSAGQARTGPQTLQLRMDVLLRLIAIGLVISQHASDYKLYGGAWILILLMGFSIGRFQINQIAMGNPITFLLRMLYPLLPFYFLILVTYEVFRRNVPMSYWFMAGNYFKWYEGSLLNVYWFVSLYVQIIIFLALITAIPKARYAAVTSPWKAAAAGQIVVLMILSGIIVLRQTISLEDFPYYPQRGLIEGLSIFSLGWMICHRQGWVENLITAGACGLTLIFLMQIDMTMQIGILLGMAILALWVNASLPVPLKIGILVNRLAASTLFIYLIHQIVVTGIMTLQLPQPPTVFLALVLSSVIALWAHRCFGFLDGIVLNFLWARTKEPLRRGDEVGGVSLPAEHRIGGRNDF